MRNPNAKVSDPNTFFTCPGSRKHIEYSVKLKEDGTLSFIESGYTDIQDQINAWYPLTDMHYIVSKLMAGDVSIINRVQSPPMYGDFTKMPKSPIEVLNLVNDSKRFFEHLPVDYKAKYDNDFNKWFASFEKQIEQPIKVDENVAVNEKPASSSTE